MKEEIAKAWVADLRTNPPQAKEVLFDGKGYCCLGRLCVVLGMKPVQENHGFIFERCEKDDEYGWKVLGPWAQETAGLRTKTGETIDQSHELTQMNDEGYSFVEIADFIEANWRNL